MTDILSGHTAAQNTLGADGLRDGDALSSASLTNMMQGIHGNGILRLEDGAFGSTRNATNGAQPGAMIRASASTLTVSGGYAVLDGVLYEFGGGPTVTKTLTLGNTSHGSGGVALAAAGEEALYVIYVASNNGEFNIHYEAGSPVNTANGLYPTIPSQYLIDYDTVNANSNMKTIVLAIVRVKYLSSGGGSHNVDIQEINDKRVFLPSAIRYMVPLSTGAISSNKVNTGGADGVNTITHLKDLLHPSGDVGDLAVGDSVTALWPSHPRFEVTDGTTVQVPAGSGDAGYGQGPSRGADLAGNHVKNELYFAGRNNEETGHFSSRLAGRGVDATATIINANSTFVVTADGDSFFILKAADGVTITLNPETDGTNYKFAEGQTIEVCNESAGTGLIVFDQPELNASLSPTHRASFIYEGSKWMRCDYQSAIIAAGAAPAIYDNSGTPAFVAGITQAEVLTLLGVESGATADQTDAEIKAAVEAATDSNTFTDADHTKLNAIEASATADQTGAQIKAAYETEANAFTDAQFTKLAGIETLADVTDATNVNAAGAIMHTDLGTKGTLAVGDGAGDATILGVGTDTHVLTADSAEASGVKWAAAAASGAAPAIEDSSGTPVFATGITKAEVLTLLNVEDGADVTDATNVTTAGALMDSEMTDLAGVKGVTISTLQLKPSEGAFVNGDKTKLDAIESSATADQLAADVPVAATASNYTAATADVEAHLAGIDTALASAGGTLAFKTLVVAGQSDIVADTTTDTLTIVGAGATTITTTAGSDTLTITSADTDTMDAGADAYAANPGRWAAPAPPATTQEALDRIAIYLATHVAPTVGGALP